jgi:hypothetical protein
VLGMMDDVLVDVQYLTGMGADLGDVCPGAGVRLRAVGSPAKKENMNYATQFEKYGMAFPAGSRPK